MGLTVLSGILIIACGVVALLGLYLLVKAAVQSAIREMKEKGEL